MPVSVNQLPVKVDGGGSPADAIAKALNIVSAVYGIKTNSAALDTHHEELKKAKLANTQLESDVATKQSSLKALQDPNSPETQQTRLLGKAAIEQLKSTGAFKNNPKPLDDLSTSLDSQTGFQIHNTFETSPVLKSITGLAAASDKNSILATIASSRAAGVENAKDSIASRAGDHFDKDPILTKINKQKQQVELDRHTLSTAPVLTPQIINEIQQGIANAISGGGSAGLGKTEQVEIQTAKQKVAELQQRFTSDPTPVNDPKLVEYFQGVLARLGEAYDKNGYARAQQLYNGKKSAYRSNPAAVQVMKEKVESYKPSESVQDPGGKQPPGGHMTVEQKGHTFNWNSQTGQYE